MAPKNEMNYLKGLGLEKGRVRVRMCWSFFSYLRRQYNEIYKILDQVLFPVVELRHLESSFK